MSTRQWAWLTVLNERAVDVGAVLLPISVGAWHLFLSVLPIKDLLIWVPESCLWLSTCALQKDRWELAALTFLLPGGLVWRTWRGLCPSQAPLALGSRGRSQPDGDWLALSDTRDSQENGHI